MRKVSGIVEVPGMGQNLTDTVLQDIKNFTGEYLTDIILLVDVSTSIEWRGLKQAMADGIASFKEAMLGSKNASSIRVCVLKFGAKVPKDVDFVPLEKMDTTYESNQRQTKLYEAICVANNLMLNHISEAEKKNIYVNGMIAIATDGEDIGSHQFYDDAVAVVSGASSREIDIKVIAIGNEAADTARGLGLTDDQILTDEDQNNPHKIREMWNQVSQSAQATSQKAATGSSVTSTMSTAAKFNFDD